MPIIYSDPGGSAYSSGLTYSSLQTMVARMLHRDGDTTFTDRLPDLILLAESKISAQISARPMESRWTLTVSAGDPYVATPGDMIEARRLIVTSTDPVRELKYVSPEFLSARFSSSAQAEPAVWTVIGGSIQVAPIPDSSYTLELTYRQRIPSLSADNPTNWMLAGHPDAYVYGTLIQCLTFIGPHPMAEMFMAGYAQAIKAINDIDWYSGTTPQVRAV